MSSFWKEEVITTEQRTFIKGTFKAKYFAHLQDERSSHHTEFYDMHLYDIEITILNVKPKVDFTDAEYLLAFGGMFTQPVNCFDPSSDSHFQLNLMEPKIADPVLSKITKDGAQRFGTITGHIYGFVQKFIDEKVRTECFYDNIASPASVNASHWIRTAKHEFLQRNGVRYRRDYYKNNTGGFYWSNWYTVGSPRSFSSILGGLIATSFTGALIMLLLMALWPWVIFFGILLVLNIIYRVVNKKLGYSYISLISVLCLFIYFGAIATKLYRSPSKATVINKTDNTNSTAVIPVKTPHTQNNDHTHTLDSIIIHHRSWSDLYGNQYDGNIKILRSVYGKACSEYQQLQNAGGLSDVYKIMATHDGWRLSGVYPLFDSLRRVRNLDTLAFANMVVSFVQDIPYSTVTDGLCTQNTNGLSAPAIPGQFNCIGGIPYGVQSPVQFMGNLKGDCDTRTLFLFTVLDHYHYQVAILGSQAFKHSLLGLAIPLPGSAKMAGNNRYVLWETTSKGFAAGHLSPEIDHMDYWNFYLINTTF